MSSLIPSGYEFDVFISYERSPIATTPWVTNFFYPYLQDWLKQKLGGQPVQVFIDQESIKPGQRWPQRLQDALVVSKCLVPVFSGGYFLSQWCSSEWANFVEREGILGLDSSAESLIVPIIHNDGKWLTPKAKEYNHIDFSGCHSPSPNFPNEPTFPLFYRKIQELAEAVAERVSNAPPFDPTWPKIAVNPIRRLLLPKMY